jgi:hypothetical protein
MSRCAKIKKFAPPHFAQKIGAFESRIAKAGLQIFPHRILERFVDRLGHCSKKYRHCAV